MNSNPINNKPATASSTVTRDLRELDVETGNIYESLVIMSKRANQISNNIKEELHQKLSEFASANDNLEEVFENREQIEISKYYEKLPKPSLVAVQEFLDGKVYYRNPTKEAYTFLIQKLEVKIQKWGR
jgi:DNA-directed RNA polymerase subunit K/omega